MPSATDDEDRPPKRITVARRYQRIERPLSYAVALLAALLVGVAFLRVSPL
ncbi:hypothetical protein [Halorubrum sp. BOL3-1]|uniref:hypothetical protein n=1 Tax=Halorubrum sp. BOL3-1 TaxID=2497325 RepID=UPI00140AD54A|nr:hypothetical protein [Halorubrum sp. BOL3-1]